MENETKEKVWDFWLTNLPHMEKKISFNDLWNKLNKPIVTESQKSTEELLEWAERIKKADYEVVKIDDIKTK